MDKNVFQNASLSLIDESYTYLNSEEVQPHKKHMDAFHFAHEFRTLAIRSHRRAGHSTLINQLAFDVGDEIGRRYSTLVMAPSHDRARYNYEPHNMYYHEDDVRRNLIDELGIEYADEYRRIIRDNSSNMTGKVLSATSFDGIGFVTKRYLAAQRDAVFKLTGHQVEKFDLMLIDGASDIKRETLDKIFINFMDDVELFVLFQ